MWAQRVSQVCAIASGLWVVAISSWLIVGYLDNPGAWGLLVLALFSLAFAAVGVISVFLPKRWITMASAIVLTLVMFAPGLLGIPYIPAALAMVVAALMRSFDPPETLNTAAATHDGDTVRGI